MTATRGRGLFLVRLAGRGRFGIWHQRLYHGKEGAFVALDLGRHRLGWWYKPRTVPPWPNGS